MKHLDLFSGIGGFALAAQWVGGIETVQFVEIDNFAQKVLTKNFRGIPIHGDITTYIPPSRGIDLITAGFPCQDISLANTNGQKGLQGDRSSLFFEVIRIACLCRPRYIVLENVPALLTSREGSDMGQVLWELQEVGFDAEWRIIPASSVGAYHRRERVFIVACANGVGVGREGRRDSQEHQRAAAAFRTHGSGEIPGFLCPSFWEVYSRDGRTRHGVSSRMDRFKGIGNAVVPQVAAIVLNRVKELESLEEKHG